MSKSHFVGFVLPDCPLPCPNMGHVILAKPSPILLYQIGTRDTRILVDVPGQMPSIGNGNMRRYMEEFVMPQLPVQVRESFIKGLEGERLRSMPNSWLPPSRAKMHGLILMGDANNMRHPLTGGGMTVALWDVVHLRNALRPIKDLNSYELVTARTKLLHYKRKHLSSVVNILANALYELFSANDSNES